MRKRPFLQLNLRVTRIIERINSRLTWYSHLNSCSRNERRRSSHESSNAVRIGSLEERAIKDGEAKALYAFIRLLECLRESSLLDVTHSSHLLLLRERERNQQPLRPVPRIYEAKVERKRKRINIYKRFWVKFQPVGEIRRRNLKRLNGLI